MLPRWIKGSEVKAGMTIVGNTDSDGFPGTWMWNCLVTGIRRKTYDTGSDKIFFLDIEAMYLNHNDIATPSGEGRIWSHSRFLLIAQEN
jgi:hypothetical protein